MVWKLLPAPIEIPEPAAFVFSNKVMEPAVLPLAAKETPEPFTRPSTRLPTDSVTVIVPLFAGIGSGLAVTAEPSAKVVLPTVLSEIVVPALIFLAPTGDSMKLVVPAPVSVTFTAPEVAVMLPRKFTAVAARGRRLTVAELAAEIVPKVLEPLVLCVTVTAPVEPAPESAPKLIFPAELIVKAPTPVDPAVTLFSVAAVPTVVKFTVVPAEMFLPAAIVVVPLVPISVSFMAPVFAVMPPSRFIVPPVACLNIIVTDVPADMSPKLAVPAVFCVTVTAALAPVAVIAPKEELPALEIVTAPFEAVTLPTLTSPAVLNLAVVPPLTLPLMVVAPLPV
jgi:hypothetical protein